MSEAGFERVMYRWIWLEQNDGQTLHKTPGDCGGWTAWGITMAAFTAWRLKHRRPAPSMDDLRLITIDERLDFYHQEYWMPAAGDRLAVGPDACVMDMAVMSGPGAAARLLRKVTNQKPGSWIDQATIDAARAMGPTTLVLLLCHAHNAYDAALRNDGQFQGGWFNRVQGLQTLALSWVLHGEPPPPAQAVPAET